MDLTQEQIAKYLGVTTPAVNKWEKGNSYPDITILPALARLLRVDLNTLLSFSDELTNQEIGKFTNDLAGIIDEKGYDEGLQLAIDKIYNNPNCYKLIYLVASILQGALFMYGVKDKYKYEKQIEKLFERLGNCDNPELCNHAKFKSKSVDSKMGLMILDSIIRELETSKEANFLKSDPKFIELLNVSKD